MQDCLVAIWIQAHLIFYLVRNGRFGQLKLDYLFSVHIYVHVGVSCARLFRSGNAGTLSLLEILSCFLNNYYNKDLINMAIKPHVIIKMHNDGGKVELKWRQSGGKSEENRRKIGGKPEESEANRRILRFLIRKVEVSGGKSEENRRHQKNRRIIQFSDQKSRVKRRKVGGIRKIGG